jgi:hypothetical protein
MILICGETRNLSGSITRMLLAQGKPIRALVRPASNHQPLAEAGAELVFGDLKDRASLDLDAVKTYEKVLGRPVPVLRVQPGGPVPGLPPDHWGMLAGFDLGDWVVPLEETAKAYGVRLTTLEEFARNTLGSAA